LVKYCDEHVLGAPGSGQINWTGYYTTDAPEKVVAHYLEALGSRNHEKSSDGRNIWRFPVDRPERVLEVTPRGGPAPSGNCRPIPATARALVIISMLTRPY
jgi:hypothetical protein